MIPIVDGGLQDRAEAEQRRLAEAEFAGAFGRPIDSFERLSHSKLTVGVWRVATGAETAILKVLRPLPPSFHGHEREHFHYWRREALAYDGGIPASYLRAGVRGPRLLAKFDRADGDVALWLEDVRGVAAGEWAMDRYAEFGERLGRAQGAFLAGRSVPSDDWLCRDFVRQYLGERDTHIEYELLASDEAWARPRMAAIVGAGLRERLVRLHAERERFLTWLDAVPRVVAHLDVWTENMIDVDDATVLLDWAFVGVAGAGEDIGNVAPWSGIDFRVPANAVERLDGELWHGYTRGLRTAGWVGDERLIRLGVCASVVKYEWVAPHTLWRAEREGPTQSLYGDREVDAEAFFAVRASVLEFVAERAAEARRIAHSLGLD